MQLLNGEGELAEAVLDAVEGRRASALVSCVRVRPRNALEITLVVGLSKPKAMDIILQKGTELAVDRIVIVSCARSVSRLDPQELVERVEKWRAVAVEALKQSGGFWLPQIEAFPDVRSRLEQSQIVDSRWVAALSGDARHPRESLDRTTQKTGGFPKSIEVWIGPEGDFSGEETALLLSHDARPVSLGDNTLRSETAALYCACVLRYEAGARRASKS